MSPPLNKLPFSVKPTPPPSLKWAWNEWRGLTEDLLYALSVVLSHDNFIADRSDQISLRHSIKATNVYDIVRRN